MSPVWPPLPMKDFEATKNALILWTQVVGKVRIARTPLINQWWNAPLYLTSKGLTTSLIPGDPGRSFAIDFDFMANSLDINVTDGTGRRLALGEQHTVEQFHARLMEMLDELGLHTDIWPVPVELEVAVPFPDDDAPRAYDPEQALRFWRLLVEAHRVLLDFRSRFVGKASPVHLFWGALDLATTRFSGREAPPWKGEVPNCGPHVMLEAYSQEVSSAGYWPGGDGEGFFYAYAYPEPEGFRDMPSGPSEARYDTSLGEFVLPYEAVRTAADPDAKLLEFLQKTYEAAAIRADWPRASLER
ncbi:DUF5996 family protein [Actinocorallia sp. API 0066]|uniref:DUF5996 family protein n=1 Tax=Actinocorallia sp. API 0066 TaxID=2896846 RepID=UPI001E43595F|nr:DUF5996 family protein [Actinocorallia sp. API 0066]MCD0451529.1 DUF5996 family protein [Actinocorallia sp. API 0066]